MWTYYFKVPEDLLVLLKMNIENIINSRNETFLTF